MPFEGGFPWGPSFCSLHSFLFLLLLSPPRDFSKEDKWSNVCPSLIVTHVSSLSPSFCVKNFTQDSTSPPNPSDGYLPKQTCPCLEILLPLTGHSLFFRASLPLPPIIIFFSCSFSVAGPEAEAPILSFLFGVLGVFFPSKLSFAYQFPLPIIFHAQKHSSLHPCCLWLSVERVNFASFVVRDSPHPPPPTKFSFLPSFLLIILDTTFLLLNQLPILFFYPPHPLHTQSVLKNFASLIPCALFFHPPPLREHVISAFPFRFFTSAYVLFPVVCQ